MGSTPWTGDWVGDRLGIRVECATSSTGREVHDLAGLALRRNPRRAHLLVSPVLGKHVPVDPREAIRVGTELGHQVAEQLSRRGISPAASLTIGYAETATALGHVVASELGAPYLHTTRRPARGAQLLRFSEEHSHSQEHRLLPRDRDVLARADAVVLVDDELSTGRTALNTIRAVHAVRPRPHYVVAALLDMRDGGARREAASVAADLGVRIDFVCLAAGHVLLGSDVAVRAAELLEELETPLVGESGNARVVRRLRLHWPEGVPTGGMHGFAADDEPAFNAAVDEIAELVVSLTHHTQHLHVLGTEELMYLPLRLAGSLAERLASVTVTFSSTTRSPVAVVDDPAYAVRSVLAFPAHDEPAEGSLDRYVYNLADRGIDRILVVTDESGSAPALFGRGGLLDRLSDVAADVLLAVVPDAGCGP